jgi:ribosomal small subunit protein bTHX
MGKGDKKSKRGKIVIGSFGVRRSRKKKKVTVKPAKTKTEPKIRVPKVKEEKKSIPAEPVVEIQAAEVAEAVEKKVIKKPAARKTVKKETEENPTLDLGAEAKPKPVKSKKKSETETAQETPPADEAKQE